MSVDYLRISITDRCNLNCFYCMPFSRGDFAPYKEILRYEEIVQIVDILSEKGIRKVRITGGEPLLRRDLDRLVRMLKGIKKINEISLTTNGILLKDKIDLLSRAGLDRINVSLNSLNSGTYKKITGFDGLDAVRYGINRAVGLGLVPLKINTIIFKGMNDNEVIDFVKLTLDKDISVRFIEYFPTNKKLKKISKIAVFNNQVKAMIEKTFGELKIKKDLINNGPAKNYYIRGAKGTVGFINSATENFCEDCIRLRLNAEGRLYLCLFSAFSIDMKKIIRGHLPKGLIDQQLTLFLKAKSAYRKNSVIQHEFSMNSIGG